jgi:hypothetical protein
MPSAKKRPPSDPAQAAKSILDAITGEGERPEKPAKNPAAVELGRRGGEARKAALPAEERSRIAKEAARKRFADRPKDDGVG